MKALSERAGRGLGVTVATILALTAAAAAGADPGTWSVEVAPVYGVVGGHDQNVLDARRSGGTEAIELDTDSAVGYRASVLYDRGGWDYGMDFFIHRTKQSAGPLTEAAAGAGSPVVWELPNRSFVSTGPGEVLYFQSLEDTTIEQWIVDLWARRPLGAGGPWAVLFGVRNADFDNDFRAIGGIEDVGGTRIDASSNYSRMIGPLVGLSATFERGRHEFEAGVRQSVVFGDIELSRTLRDFAGPPGAFAGPPEDVPPGTNRQTIRVTDSIEVPMTDLLLAWRVRLGDRWSLGARFDATAWSGLAVPPGVVPRRPNEREETTLYDYGLAATIGFRF